MRDARAPAKQGKQEKSWLVHAAKNACSMKLAILFNYAFDSSSFSLAEEQRDKSYRFAAKPCSKVNFNPAIGKLEEVVNPEGSKAELVYINKTRMGRFLVRSVFAFN